MAKDILLEIGVEEIPAGYLTDAAGALYSMCETAFADARVGYRQLNVYSSCRRLVVYVKDASEKQRRLRVGDVGQKTKAKRGP